MTAESPAAAVPVADAGFVCTADGARWVGNGPLTFDTAGAVLEAAQTLPLPSTGVVDCAGIAAVDSAGVALMLALKRRAAEQGANLELANVPAALTALATLYDVEQILEG